MSALILIPARLGSTRLPRKMLADIAGKPLIQHVLERAQAANIGPVALACDHQEIADIAKGLGLEAVITDPALPSGSDRVYAALSALDPDRKINKAINLQGDIPNLEPEALIQTLKALENPEVHISTAAALITNQDEVTNPNVVKIALSGQESDPIRRALYFSRAPIPSGEGPHYHHIGLYGFQRQALERFVSLPPSTLELRERLEQLRALEDGMRIAVAMVNHIPVSVDTSDDLERARQLIAA